MYKYSHLLYCMYHHLSPTGTATGTTGNTPACSDVMNSKFLFIFGCPIVCISDTNIISASLHVNGRDDTVRWCHIIINDHRHVLYFNLFRPISRVRKSHPDSIRKKLSAILEQVLKFVQNYCLLGLYSANNADWTYVYRILRNMIRKKRSIY
jgi:hypothetical protein